MEDHQIAQVDIGTRTINMVESLGRIDTSRLLEEVEETGATALWWGDFAARARRLADGLKFQAEITHSEVAQKVRREMVKKGEKVTEDQVKEQCRLDKEYQAAYLKYLDAEADASRIESAKFTIARKQSTCEAMAPLLFDEARARREPRYRGEARADIQIPDSSRLPRPSRTPMPRGG